MSSEGVRHDDERVRHDDERVGDDDKGVRDDDEGVRDDDDETLATTTRSRGGDHDADDGIEEMAFYVDDVILWLDSKAMRRQVFDAARRFRNFIDERIGSLRTPPEATEE